MKSSAFELRCWLESAVMAFVNKTSSDAVPNPPPQETDNHCAVCNKSPARQCTQCRSCSYCSTECQRTDFASHIILCKQLVVLPARPTPEHKRAIFFPENEINPRIVWIKCTADSMDDVYYEWVDVSPYLGHKKPGKFYAPRKNYHVSLIARDDFLSDGSSTNKSIIATAGPSMTRPLAFLGPMVAIREVDYDTYCDITLADFRCLSEYLRCYGAPASANPTNSPGKPIHAIKASRGVKIRRRGGDIPQRSDIFVPVDITANTMLASFGDGVLSSLSVRLGMPIRIWKYPNAKDDAGAFNPDARSLLREVSPIHPLFGHPHPYWDAGIEDVLAVREDGQDLSVQDVRIMCGFGAILYCDMVVNVMAGNNMVGKQKISESITCENMARRWKEGDDCMYAE